ncbi:M48 family metallopeptidase [Trinickia sp.]|uniref:M48 family metallopeptidase n=1 Tax=Trinickia sp. TaxID=2571163 RepID=UPI003F7D0C91
MASTQLAAQARVPRPMMFAFALALVWRAALVPASAAGAGVGAPPALAASTVVAEPGPRVPIRIGEPHLFRNPVAPPVVEAQSIAEYGRLMDAARREGRLLPADDTRVRRFQTLIDKLAPLAAKWSDRAKNWQWEVNIVRSRDVRMVSFPGGKLVVYSGLLDRMNLTEDELAMLTGHEMAHALREQVREQLGEQQVPLGAVALSRLFGVAEFGEASAPAPAAPLAKFEFDATDETEADVIGTDIAARAGFDPRAALTLWDKLAIAARGEKDGGFIAIHPYSAERRHDLVKRLPDMLALYEKARAVATTPASAYKASPLDAGRSTRP